jgi:hypothetical protein
MNQAFQSKAIRALLAGAGCGVIFLAGYSMGSEHALSEKNPQYMKDVHRKAKEMISKASNDIIRERREQRLYDAKFSDIVSPPKEG